MEVKFTYQELRHCSKEVLSKALMDCKDIQTNLDKHIKVEDK